MRLLAHRLCGTRKFVSQIFSATPHQLLKDVLYVRKQGIFRLVLKLGKRVKIGERNIVANVYVVCDAVQVYCARRIACISSFKMNRC